MKLFPAIDLRDGKAVRLYQGDYDQMTVYSEDPVDVARSFKEKGASYLHLVDLDGAKDGQLVNFETIRRIVEEVDLFVEVGGGIRDEKRICQYLDLGVGRVILGTIAVKEPEFLKEMVGKYGEKIADRRGCQRWLCGYQRLERDHRSGKLLLLQGPERYGCEDCDLYGCRKALLVQGPERYGCEDYNIYGYLTGRRSGRYEYGCLPEALQQIEGLEVTASGGISFEREITELKDIVAAAIFRQGYLQRSA